MMNVAKHIAYWKNGAEKDWSIAGFLMEKASWRHAFFYADWALEKAFKAHICRKTADLAPRTRNLERLARIAGIEVSQTQAETLRQVFAQYIEQEYPEFTIPSLSEENARRLWTAAEDIFHRWTRLMDPLLLPIEAQPSPTASKTIPPRDVDPSITGIVQDYLGALAEAGLRVSFGMLYGSQVKGKAHEWSDIDVMVISLQFDGAHDREPIDLLWRTSHGINSRIEPHHCGEKQWAEDDGTPIIETVRREGLRIDLPRPPRKRVPRP